MDGSSFYVLETKGSTLLNDMLDETENITKQADRISLIQRILGHLVAYTEKGFHCDGHLAAQLRDNGKPPVKEFRIGILGGSFLLRIIFIVTHAKTHYLTSYFIKPRIYDKQKEKNINTIYSKHIKRARKLIKNKDCFIPLKDLIQSL